MNHIQGILDLTRKLREARVESRELPSVRRFWFNELDRLVERSSTEGIDRLRSQFHDFSELGEHSAPRTIDSFVSSFTNGVSLRAEATAMGVSLNREFAGGPVVADGSSRPLDMGKGLRFRVIAPTKSEIEAFSKEVDGWLKKRTISDARLTPPWDGLEDSIPRLPSLVVLAETEDKTMLLTGSARGDRILQGLESKGRSDAGRSAEGAAEPRRS
jgi:hypothetical protein